MDPAIQQVLMQAPASATAEDARAALERCNADVVAAIADLWADPATPMAAAAPTVGGLTAKDIMDEKDAESVGKIAEMREICNKMTIEMEKMFGKVKRI